jgi:hypothetical protein
MQREKLSIEDIERGFVVPIGSFTFRRPGLRTVACHLGLPSTSDTRADLQSASALRQNVTGLFHGGGERGPTRLFSCVLVAGTLHRSIGRSLSSRWRSIA